MIGPRPPIARLATRCRAAARAGASALALAALAGCNLAPAYRPPVVATPAQYRPQPGWGTATPADALPRGAWWQAFGDPLLDQLEQKLGNDNPDLAAAVARHDEARAFADQARGGLLPAVSLNGNATRNRQSNDRPLRGNNQPNVYDSDQLNGVAGYELDLWGKLRNLLASRKALAQASDADRATIQLSLQAQLADAYFQLRGLDAGLKLYTETVTAYQKSRDLTVLLFKGKIAAQMDVSRADAQLNAALAAREDIVVRRDLLANAIAVLVGSAPADLTIATGDLPQALPAIPDSLPSTLLERRPDVASAERAIFSANADIGVARAAFFPTITFDALGGIQSSGTNPFKVGDLFWSLGPSITLPIFDGGRLKAALVERRARFRETAAHYRATALVAFREVEDNRALLARLAREADFDQAGVTAAQQTSKAANSLYGAGATSYIDVVIAQTALLQAQQSALDVHIRRFVAAVDLIRALGGGWTRADLAKD